MAKRAVRECVMPEGCEASCLENCHVVGASVVPIDDKATAVVIFKDSLGEYRAEWMPGYSWVWG